MSNFLKLSRNPISVSDVYKEVESPSCGGVSVFVGTTRDHFDGKLVVKLEYESYEEMALKEIQKICVKIRDKWDVNNIAIIHRLGEVPVGEIGVAIAISSTHRENAIKSVEFAIDNLKLTVPIWKKEVYGDGSSSWKQNCEGCDQTSQ